MLSIFIKKVYYFYTLNFEIIGVKIVYKKNKKNIKIVVDKLTKILYNLVKKEGNKKKKDRKSGRRKEMENKIVKVKTKTSDGWAYGVVEMAEEYIINVLEDRTGLIEKALSNGTEVIQY